MFSSTPLTQWLRRAAAVAVTGAVLVVAAPAASAEQPTTTTTTTTAPSTTTTAPSTTTTAPEELPPRPTLPEPSTTTAPPEQQQSSSTTTPESAGGTPPPADYDPDLVGDLALPNLPVTEVAVTGDRYRKARAALAAAEVTATSAAETAAETRAVVAAAAVRVTDAEQAAARLDRQVDALRADEQAVTERLSDATQQLHDVARRAYVTGGVGDAAALDAAGPVDAAGARVLLGAVGRHTDEVIDDYAAALEAVTDDLAALSDEVVAASTELQAAIRSEAAAQEAATATSNVLQDAERRRDAASDAVVAAFALSEFLVPAVPGGDADAGIESTTGIPVIAVDAYVRAARRDPACNLPWTVIAGIGRVESSHGTYAGSRPGLDGVARPAIIGIPLDGTRGTRAIPDTDDGALDGDVIWDRAVGPMQFIPTSWAGLRVDGDGDGIKSPHDLHDAAATTAAYLCRYAPAGGFTDDVSFRPGIFAYNHSNAYVDKVLSWHRVYKDLVTPEPGS